MDQGLARRLADSQSSRSLARLLEFPSGTKYSRSTEEPWHIKRCCRGFLSLRTRAEAAHQEAIARKKDECMFEKKLGKRVKTRYDNNIKSEGLWKNCQIVVLRWRWRFVR